MDIRKNNHTETDIEFDLDVFFAQLETIVAKISEATNYFKDIKDEKIARLFQNGIPDALIYQSLDEEKKKKRVIEGIAKVVYNNETLIKSCAEFDIHLSSYSDFITRNFCEKLKTIDLPPNSKNIHLFYEWLIESFKPITESLTRSLQSQKKELLINHPNFFFDISNSLLNGCVTELIRRALSILTEQSSIENGYISAEAFAQIKPVFSVLSTSALVIPDNQSVNQFYHFSAEEMLKTVLVRAYQLNGYDKVEAKTQNALNNLGFNEKIAQKMVGDYGSPEKSAVPKIKISPRKMAEVTKQIKDKSKDLDLSPKSLAIAKMGVFHLEQKDEETGEGESPKDTDTQPVFHQN